MKGWTCCCARFPSLRRQRPEIAVLLVGGGPEEDKLRALARELEIGDSVVFAGRVPHEEMQRYYDLADLLVFPRRVDAVDRTGDAAEAARGDGAGADRRRLERRRTS